MKNMNIKKLIACSFSGLATAILMAGCSYPRISSKEVPSAFITQVREQPKNTAPGSVLVAIRWPVALDDEAKAMFENNWAEGHHAQFRKTSPLMYLIDGIAMSPLCLFCYWWDSTLTTNTYEHIPDTSTYYAMEFYRELAKHIPTKNIVLEPQYITTSDGKLVNLPVIQNKLPAVFVVDISDKVGVSPHHTWVLSPIITVNTSGLASPQTCGAIASDSEHAKVPDFSDADCSKLSSRKTPFPDFWDYWFSDNPNTDFKSIQSQNKLPLTPNVFSEIPALSEAFDESYLADSALPSFDSKKQIQSRSLEIYANAITDGLSRFDLNKATQVGFAEYVGEYDTGLKDRLMNNAILNKEEQIRLTAIARLADLEKEWITAQDKHVADSILDGPYGQSFRATRLARKDQSDRKQQADMAMAMSMMAASANSGMLSGGHHSIAQSMQGLTTAMSILVQHQASIQALEENFYSQFGDDIEVRNQILEVELEGKTRQVTAKDRQELRRELKTIYREFVDKSKTAKI